MHLRGRLTRVRITEEQKKAFADLLRSARESRGWKQFEAAERAGIPATTLSRLEHGPYEGMRFEDILLLSRLYGLSVDHLAEMVGIPLATEVEADGHLRAVYAAVQALEAEQRAFVIRVLQAVLKGL